MEQLGQAAITRTPYEIGTLLNRTGDTNVPFYNISPREDEEVIAYRPTESFYNQKALLESTDIYQLLSGKDTGQGFLLATKQRQLKKPHLFVIEVALKYQALTPKVVLTLLV